MRTFITSVVCLLVGVWIGFYIAYRHWDRHSTNEAMQAMVEGMESHEALMASMSARTISLIDSGQDQQAVQMLSFPIASYYYVYASSEFTNAQRLKLRALIDGLARSNQVVASQIATEMKDKKK